MSSARLDYLSLYSVGGAVVRISLVPYSANLGQVHKLPKNRPIDSIDVNRLRKNNISDDFANSPLSHTSQRP